MEITLTFLKTFLIGLTYVSPVILFLAAIVACFGLWVGRLEGWRRSEAIYFAFVTATTVGYGDMRPGKPLSRVIAIATAFVGLLLTGIFVATGLYAIEIALALGAG